MKLACRLIVGAVFAASGLLKALDPVGTGLKVAEYLGVGYSWGPVALGIALSALEFVTGAGVLFRPKSRVFSMAALVLSGAFLVVTFISAAFGWVADCGCFGEAIYIAPWPAFFKNVALTAMAAVIVFKKGCGPELCRQRKGLRGKALAGLPLASLGVAFAGVAFVGFALFSLWRMPIVDFTQFRVGARLLQNASEAPQVRYKTTLIYAKGGRRAEFDIRSLPDSTWRFVTSRTEVVEGSEREAAAMRLALKDGDGNYVTDSVLSSPTRKVFVSVYRPLNQKKIARLQAFAGRNTPMFGNVNACNTECYILSALTPSETASLVQDIFAGASERPTVLYADFKVVITLNRSNGGLTFVEGDEIVKKAAI